MSDKNGCLWLIMWTIGLPIMIIYILIKGLLDISKRYWKHKIKVLFYLQPYLTTLYVGFLLSNILI